jgi:hypothetical protein
VCHAIRVKRSTGRHRVAYRDQNGASVEKLLMNGEKVVDGSSGKNISRRD